MQFQAKGATAADSVLGQLGLGQIPAQVAVKFPVGPVARIALAGTPDRQGRIAVAAEKSHSRWAADRCINAIAGTGYGVKKAVGVQHAVAQAVLDEDLIQTLVVGAFRQPNAQGRLADQTFVFPHGGDQLGPDGLRAFPQQGQVAVGGGAGDQIQHPQALQAPKAWQQFCLAVLPIGNQGSQAVAEVLGRCLTFGGGQLQ